MAKVLRLKASHGRLGLAVCCVFTSGSSGAALQHHSVGDWGGAPCTSGISRCWRRNGIYTPLGWSVFLWEIRRLYPWAFWHVCFPSMLLGVSWSEAPTWHVGCAELGIPSAEPALDGAWGVTPAAFPGDCFGAPAAPGYEQCCGSWSRLERQLRPAQKVCEKSRCCLSWATGQPSFLVKPNQSLPSVAQGLQGVKVDPWLYFGFHLSDSKIKKCKFWILSVFSQCSKAGPFTVAFISVPTLWLTLQARSKLIHRS